ncbi:hypothetical protein Tco_1313866 [Tanacetum coccineum]
MFKWVWRFYSQNSSLWARVMKAIHGDDGRIGKDIKACNQSCWLNIVNEINVLKNQGINFLDFMHLKLGNGDNISFWNDNWIGGNTLKNLYPRIYALENSKQVTVCAKLADIALDASFRKTEGRFPGDFSFALYSYSNEMKKEVFFRLSTLKLVGLNLFPSR